MEALGELCARRGMWLICDETYAHCIFDGRRHTSAVDNASCSGRSITVRTFSKGPLRPSWRLGWVVTPRELVPRIEALSKVMHYGLQSFLQAGAAAVLHPAHREALLQAEALLYERRRDVFIAALVAEDAGRSLAVPLRPDGGMFVLVDCRAARVSSLVLATVLLERHGVAVMPGEGFSGNGGCSTHGFLRVALVAPESELAVAAVAIAACAFHMSQTVVE